MREEEQEHGEVDIGSTSPQDQPQEEPGVRPPSAKRSMGAAGLSRRFIVLIVLAIVVLASGIFVWAEFFGPRSMKDLAALVVNDPGPESPGFKHSLAGHKFTVKGEVTNITTHITTIGNLSFIELDDFDLLHLVVWGQVPYDVGDKIKTRVSFEWSFCNNESHVYSPQLDFPSLATLPSIGLVLKAVSVTAGTVAILGNGTANPLVLTVFDQYPDLSLEGASASLRVGSKSFAAEYIDVLGIGSENHSYGRELDSINDLAIGTSNVGILEFNDADHDGKLSRNDTFAVNNVSKPDVDSGAYTYVIILHPNELPEHMSADAFPIDYFVMTSRGALSYVTYDSPRPYGRLETEVLSQTEARFTFACALGKTSWDDVRLSLVDEAWNREYWYPDAGALDDGSMSLEELPSISIGAVNAACTIVDIAGNGIIDEGDYFTVSAWGGTQFSPSMNYTFAVMYNPSMEEFARSTFHG